MSDLPLKPYDGAHKPRVGGVDAPSSVGGRPSTPPLSYFITQIALKLALSPKSKTAKKKRVMMLWEHGIITAGDVERLFEKYKLGAA